MHRAPARCGGTLSRRFGRYSSGGGQKYGVVGCGSNVVDRFFAVRALPKPGEKGFFQSPTRIQEGLLVGGVTLNHLAWASALGTPTALLARQCDGAAGVAVREEMRRCRVSDEFVDISADNTTSESYVFLEPGGERSIIMASGSTSTLDAERVRSLWLPAVRNAPMFSTEISQVPLSGVLELLQTAAAAGAVTVLDVDVSPSVAEKEAGLGSLDDVMRCAKSAAVLKPAKHAAAELLEMLQPGVAPPADGAEMAVRLRTATGAQMVALTEGGDGCVVAVAGADKPIRVAANKLDTVRDATGAGDAFLGGLLAGLHHFGQPWKAAEPAAAAERAVRIANATGAANCQTLGGLPPADFDASSLAALDPKLSPVVEVLRR